MISKHAVDDRKDNISIVDREKDVKLFSAVGPLIWVNGQVVRLEERHRKVFTCNRSSISLMPSREGLKHGFLMVGLPQENPCFNYEFKPLKSRRAQHDQLIKFSGREIGQQIPVPLDGGLVPSKQCKPRAQTRNGL
jgi:hypothetical protein